MSCTYGPWKGVLLVPYKASIENLDITVKLTDFVPENNTTLSTKHRTEFITIHTSIKNYYQ